MRSQLQCAAEVSHQAMPPRCAHACCLLFEDQDFCGQVQVLPELLLDLNGRCQDVEIREWLYVTQTLTNLWQVLQHMASSSCQLAANHPVQNAGTVQPNLADHEQCQVSRIQSILFSMTGDYHLCMTPSFPFLGQPDKQQREVCVQLASYPSNIPAEIS